MFGRKVTVNFNGELVTVMVVCEPNTPFEKLKERAIRKLKLMEEEKRKKESDQLWQWIEQVLR